jgi:prevent-host-death family protein
MGLQSMTITTTATNLARDMSHYSDVALSEPVVITKGGKPRNVLTSYKEYQRLLKRDQEAFAAADTPEHFIADIEATARGDRNR